MICVCHNYIISSKIGGENLIVQIDESFFHKKHNNNVDLYLLRDTLKLGTNENKRNNLERVSESWIFGIVEKFTRNLTLAHVDSRNEETLLFYLKLLVDKESTIHSDE